jgi:hypothetical protein
LSSFPHPAFRADLTRDQRGKGPEVKMFCGFEGPPDKHDCLNRIRSDVITSLLVHDKIALEIAHLTDMLETFGFEDSITILQSGCLEIVNDEGLQPIVIGDGKQNYEMGICRYTQGYEDSFERLEEILISSLKDHKGEIRAFLLQAEKNSLDLPDIEIIGNRICAEMDYDLANTNLTAPLTISSTKRNNIPISDFNKVLRLSFANINLVYADAVEADCLAIESGIKDILKFKFAPTIKNRVSDKSMQMFDQILRDKKIPDLSTLYSRGLLSIEEILGFRNDFNGKKFRSWFYDKSYDEALVKEGLLSQKPSVNSGMVKLIRWVVPTAVGIQSGVLGALASFADSYLVDRFLKGWHPLFFIDDVLGAKIKKNLAESQAKRAHILNNKWFPSMKEFELCPCKSGEYFGNCCGK